MQKLLKKIPFSILDLAVIAEGNSIQQTLANSLLTAQYAERLGYKRYWFAEHHSMESVASAATSVLIGYVAAGTSKIRVGSGGVMLPNHAPLIIAEQFGTLESLYPNRIDLGLGRAPGTDPLTSIALRRNLNSSADEFPNDVIELMNYFEAATNGQKVKAIPGRGLKIPIWLLGSSTYSAQLAAMLGLPYAFASHFAPTYLQEALEIYYNQFTPSARLKKPYAMSCVNVIAADANEEAQRLATSFYQMALGLVRNDRKPLQPPVASMKDLWTPAEEAAIKHMMQFSFIGSQASVEQQLESFVQKTGVNEIMIACHLYDQQARTKSLRLVAELFQPSPQNSDETLHGTA